MATHTTVKGDKQVKDFLRRVKFAKNSYVTIGVHQEAGQYKFSGTEKTGSSPPPTVVEVALWNEYGTSTSPERSFLRSAIDENASLINQWRFEMIDKILNKGWTVEKALTAIGFRIQVLIQNKIKSNVPPPNEPGTKAQKKRDGVGDATLIWSGLMLRSITFKVVLIDKVALPPANNNA